MRKNEIEQREKPAGRDAEDGAGGGNLAALADFDEYQASARPTTSLKSASMIWETAVGTMLEWPCA
jgi:hypothetical protein